MTTVELVRVDPAGTCEVLDVEPSLAALQQQVGGYIEGIGPDWDHPAQWRGYCDEEGKVKGLAPNPVATSLAAAFGWQRLPGDVLCGPVIFLGEDAGGDVADVPAALVGFLLEVR